MGAELTTMTDFEKIDPENDLTRKIQRFVEPALITLVALHIQEEKTYATVTYEDAVRLAEAKIAETRKILAST